MENIEEYEKDYVTIELEDGSEYKCEILGVFNCLNREYIALFKKDTENTIIYRYIEDDTEEAILDLIENEDEFNAVKEEFYKHYE